LKTLPGIDICGEQGEYHTFVYDGPVFKKTVRFSAGKKIFKNGHWFLDIVPEN
jgi:diphthine-ammonia ligase